MQSSINSIEYPLLSSSIKTAIPPKDMHIFCIMENYYFMKANFLKTRSKRSITLNRGGYIFIEYFFQFCKCKSV